MASPAEIITAAFNSSPASIRSPASKKAVGPEMDAALGDTCMPALSWIKSLSKARHSVSTAGSLRRPATALPSVPFFSSRGSARPGRVRHQAGTFTDTGSSSPQAPRGTSNMNTVNTTERKRRTGYPSFYRISLCADADKDVFSTVSL